MLNCNFIIPILYLVVSVLISSSPLYKNIDNINVREFVFCLLLFFFIGFAYTKKKTAYSYPPINCILISVIVSAIFTFAESLVASSETSLSLNVESNESFFFLYLVSMILLSPLIEEVVFRSFVFDFFLEKTKSGLMSVIFTSSLFSLAHVSYENASSFFIIFIFSIMLCFARLKTNGLTVPIAMHITTNLIVYTSIVLLFTTGRL